MLYSYAAKSNRPHRRRQTDDARIVNQMRSSRMGSSLCVLILKKKQQGLCCTGVAPATKPPMPKLERIAQVDKKNST